MYEFARNRMGKREEYSGAVFSGQNRYFTKAHQLLLTAQTRQAANEKLSEAFHRICLEMAPSHHQPSRCAHKLRVTSGLQFRRRRWLLFSLRVECSNDLRKHIIPPPLLKERCDVERRLLLQAAPHSAQNQHMTCMNECVLKLCNSKHEALVYDCC